MIKLVKYRRPTPVDFNRLIINLSNAGVTLDELHNDTGIARSTLSAWKNYDTKPNHPEGEALVTYYCERLGVELASVPRKK